MATHTLELIRLYTLMLGVTLAFTPPSLAADVSVQLDAATGFSVKNSTGASERLRVDEATGNLSRNGALFVHTTGTSNLFVGPGAGNVSTTGYGENSAFGIEALFFNTTGYDNAAVGNGALRQNTSGRRNVAVGNGALRFNTTGFFNSAVGFAALNANSTGYLNSGFGYSALRSNTTGARNSAFGTRALYRNHTGNHNSAVGYSTLRYTTGNDNSALGSDALRRNFTGVSNTALGRSALYLNTTGSRNVAVGNGAGSNQSNGSDNIYLANNGVAAENNTIRIGTPGAGAGTHGREFVAGIRGVTTVNADAIPILIDSAGQLGTVSSSRSLKTEIRDMGDATGPLFDLRPVMFRYKPEQTLPSGGKAPPEYGLIAEEVAVVFPDLVVYDDDGHPFTVKYHEMAPMLLNEMKKQQHTIDAQRQELAALTTRLARLEARE